MKYFVLAVVALVVGCVSGMGSSALAQEKDQVHSPEVFKLLTQRRDTLRSLLEIREQKYRTGLVQNDVVFAARNLVFEAELELATSGKERIAVLEKHVKNLQDFEKFQSSRARTGESTQEALLQVRATRLATQVALLREREKND